MFTRQILDPTSANEIIFYPWSITPLGYYLPNNCFRFQAINKLGERPSITLELHSRIYDFMEINKILLQLLTEAVKGQDEVIRTHIENLGQGYW